ncbi:plasma membrane calcium [Lithohypha guttulata]|nr:plasma membrane calcium [Lithohypha guttulata]
MAGTAPAIMLDTSNVSSDHTAPSTIAQSQDMLSPMTPTKSNYDGQTLHSRSPSVQTNISRDRSNSNRTYVQQSDLQIESPEEALRPDPGNEKDFVRENNPFAFTPGQLNKLLNPKSLSAFVALGGPQGIEKGLRTSLTAGLSVDEQKVDGRVTYEDATTIDKKSAYSATPVAAEGVTAREVKGQFEDRLRIYGDNRLPERKPDSIWVLIWRAYNDKILILLSIAAAISLALGLYETFSVGHGVEWIEGVAIIVAITIVVTVGAANDWQKERQFAKLNKRKDDREVKVIRSGRTIQVSVYDITAGDIMHLEPGDAVPADGIFVSGHGVKCDESSATGESDQMKKTPAIEVWQAIQDGTATKKMDPFIISGSKVLEGVGTFVVTSVGVNSSFGKIMMSLQTANEDTPLQVKLGGLANWIGGLGSSAAILLFFILLFKFLGALSGNPGTSAEKASEFLDILIVAITVIVVAVPEGLPLAVTLALAFATTRMFKENNLVRVLRACETMGNATTICSDKTGTLTQNKMTVVAGTIGVDQSFASSHTEQEKAVASFSSVFGNLSRKARDLVKASIALNSTAFEGEEKGVPTFIGSKTETALLNMAKEHLGLDGLAAERANANTVQLIPFDSKRKCMGVVYEIEGGYRMLVKGAAEIMLGNATQTVADIYTENLATKPMTGEDKERLAATIEDYAQHSLRTIGMLYRDFPQWPPAGAKRMEDDKNMAEFDDVFVDMTWVGLVGIHDPLRPGVIEAVNQCRTSGVVVRMVTGDNITTARAIATECGILRPEDNALVMEGPKFRQLNDAEMDEVIPRLRVLARSSPEDKRILVGKLKAKGETVAVTGDGTNDGPALKMADVGFSMGIAGTEVAKEASAIILLDDNFASTITALMWGRAVNDAVKKFLQFQITVNITAVILTFISAISSSENASVLTAVQLLWVNLIMDTLAALALATDPPTQKILERPPQKKSEALITHNMWKMITGQAVYQLVVSLVLYFAGMQIFGYGPERRQELDTIVFNTFVWMQIFNEFNNRRLDNKFNIFEGIHRNFWFIGINCIMVGGQIMIIFVGGAAFRIVRLDGIQWVICILCALPCMLWAILIRCLPDRYFGAAFDATINGLAVVLRPINKVLHIIFHPVAQVFRAIGRGTKRIFGKGKKNDVDDSEKGIGAVSSTPMPTVFTTAPTKTVPEVKIN